MNTTLERRPISRPKNNRSYSAPKNQINPAENSRIVRYSKQRQENKVKNFKYRIDKTEFGLVMIVCVVIDIIELILAITGGGEVVNYALDIGKIILIPIWLTMKGVSPMKPNRFLKLMVMWIVGLIPFVGSFVPEVAIGMWTTIKTARDEDEENFKKMQSN